MKIILLSIVSLLIFVIIIFVALEIWAYRTPDIKSPPNASQAEKLEAINQWFDALERQGKFNGTILLARNGIPVVQRNFGPTSALGQRRIDERTSYNLASITKHFTAFGLLMLDYEGQINFEDPITKYLPELSAYKGVSVRQLLVHTSGIPDYAFLKPDELSDLEIITVEFLLSWLNQKDNPAEFQPGTKETYSNSNYVLLAEIIARISGQSYAQFMQERIFDPLEMRDSAVVNKFVNLEILENRAYGFRRQYFYFGKPVEYDLNHLDGMAGDGNIYASAGDLVKWSVSLQEGTLLPKEVIRRLYQATTLDDATIIEENLLGDNYTPGLGTYWKNEDTSRAYANGGWQGFLHSFAWDREASETSGTLVVLSNASFGIGTFAIFDKFEEWADGFR